MSNSQIETLNALRTQAMGVVQSFTNSLSTIDKKGNRVSFERSIAFASKDARLNMAATVYAKQCDAGRFGRLVKDSLAGGVLSKAQRELFDAMIGAGDPNKETTRQFCAAVVALFADKPAKGQKAFYVGMIRDLHKAFVAEAAAAAAPVESANVVEEVAAQG